MLNSREIRVKSCIVAVVYAVLYYFNLTKFDLAIYFDVVKMFRIDIVLLIGIISVITLLVYKYRKNTSNFDFLIEALCTVISGACILSIIAVI